MIASSILLIELGLAAWLLLEISDGKLSRPHWTSQHLFVAIAIALSINLSLTLWGLPLLTVNYVLGFSFPVVVGIAWYKGIRFVFSRNQCLLLGIAAFFFIPVISIMPLQAWDAMFIWFFHGKMIFYNLRISPEAGFLNPSVNFTHPDYPLLISGMAAQIATLAGFWNDFLPKFSIIILWLAITLGYLSTRRQYSVNLLLFYLIVIFNAKRHFVMGYMDGPLALMVGLALIFMVRFVANGEKMDFLAGISAMALAASLKNEGLLALVIVVPVSFLLAPRRFWKNMLETHWQLALLALPVVSWAWLKHSWGLKSEFFTSKTLDIATSRNFSDVMLIAKYMVMGSGTLYVALILLFLVCYKVYFRREAINTNCFKLPLLFSLLFFLGLSGIYLITPMNLEPHLYSSTERVTYTVNAGLFVSIFFLFFNLKQTSPAKQPGV